MITVWHILLDDPEALTSDRLGWLSAEECARASRFHDPRHARRWQVAHVAMREILGLAVGEAPGQLRFTEGKQGKPALTNPAAPAFNLSHAEDVALLAVGGTAQIGVDVELVRAGPDLRDVTASHFAADERVVVDALSDEEMVEVFYRCWTRKEAYVKAIGTGIGHDLMSFAVSLDAGPVRLLHEHGDPARARDWTLVDLELTLPYIGALAVRSAGENVHQMAWRPR